MPNEEMSPLMSGPQAGNPAESPVNAGPLTPGGEDTPTKPLVENMLKKEVHLKLAKSFLLLTPNTCQCPRDYKIILSQKTTIVFSTQSKRIMKKRLQL